MTKKEIPKGLYKCEVCGEYKGKVLNRDLNWGHDDIDVVESIKRVTGRDQTELEKDLSTLRDIQRQSEEIITVSCLCDGILCPGCKKNKIHRPSSNSYAPESNTIGHWPGITFAGQYLCDKCRRKNQKIKAARQFHWHEIRRRRKSEGGQKFLVDTHSPTPFLFARPSLKVFQNSAFGFSLKKFGFRSGFGAQGFSSFSVGHLPGEH